MITKVSFIIVVVFFVIGWIILPQFITHVPKPDKDVLIFAILLTVAGVIIFVGKNKRKS